MQSLTAKHAERDIFWTMGGLGLQADASPLAKSIAPQCFGIATGHISPPRFELNNMGCFRLHISGTRQVALFNSTDIRKFLAATREMQSATAVDARSWSDTVTKDDMLKFATAYPLGFRRAVVGPGDLLFVPPQWLCAHRLVNVGDVVGLRWGYIAQSELAVIYNHSDNKSNPIMKDGANALKALFPPASQAVPEGQDSRSAEGAAEAIVDGPPNHDGPSRALQTQGSFLSKPILDAAIAALGVKDPPGAATREAPSPAAGQPKFRRTHSSDKPLVLDGDALVDEEMPDGQIEQPTVDAPRAGGPPAQVADGDLN